MTNKCPKLDMNVNNFMLNKLLCPNCKGNCVDSKGKFKNQLNMVAFWPKFCLQCT